MDRRFLFVLHGASRIGVWEIVEQVEEWQTVTMSANAFPGCRWRVTGAGIRPASDAGTAWIGIVGLEDAACAVV
jgi:hypothetical protein